MANNSIKILVIDSLQDNLMTMNALIRDVFPEATTLNALNGKKGLELAAQAEPDVILLDMLMTGMDGYEVCQKLKADKILCDIPVVFMMPIEKTKEALQKALESGVEAFLTKPISEIELTAQIRAMLKIREANSVKKNENERLESLVEERHKELVHELKNRKRAEVALWESEERFKLLFDRAPLAYQSLNRDGQFIEVNNTWLDRLGYTREEVVGKWFGDFMTPDSQKKVRQRFPEFVQNGEVHTEFELIHKNGNILTILFDGKIAHDLNGDFKQTHCILNDITQRKQAEEKRKAQKQRLNHILEGTNVGTWEWNVQTGETIFNEKWANIIGYTLNEISPVSIDTWMNFVHPDDLKKSEELLRKHFNGELNYYHFECRMKHKDGSWVWILDRGKVITRDEDGKPQWVFGTHTDITDRKQAEESLRESEENYKHTVENLQAGIVVHDADGTVIFCNPKASQILGLSHEQILEKGLIDPVWSFLNEDQSIMAVEDYPVSKVIATKQKLESYQLGIKTKDRNDITWVIVNANPVFNGNELKKIIVNFIDITERKRAEEKQKESEATIRKKLKAMLEPEGDITTLELSDIIDVEVLQSMMDDFYELTGMLGAVLDVSGKVLVAVGWQDICTKFHRCHPKTLKNCLESDTVLTKGVAEGEFKAYPCKNNMWDIVTPIMIGGKHVGNVFMGQYFLKGQEPDIETFRHQAKKYGFDEQEYLAALERVPRLTKETVAKGMQFYSKLAKIISNLSYSSIQQSRLLAQQKQAEEKLKESEEKFKTIVENGSVLLTLTDSLGRIEFASPQCERVIGWKKEDIIGVSLPDFIHPDDKLRVAAEQKKVTINHTIKDFEYRIIDKKNKIRWISHSAAIIQKGDRFSILSTITNITDRKQAEEELQLKAQLLNSVGQAVIATNSDGLINYLNPAAEKLYGWSAEEALEKNIMDVTVPEMSAEQATQIMEALKCGESWSGEFLVQNKAGLQFPAFVTDTPVYNKNGELQYIIGISVDISERKQAEEEIKSAHQQLQANEEALRVSEERLDLAMMVINEGIWDWHLQSNQVDFDERYYTMSGYEPGDFANNLEEFKKRVHPEDVDGVMATTEQYLTGQIDQFFVEFRFKRKDGSWMWIQGHGQIVERDKKGVPLRFIGTHSDITKRKQVEKELTKLSTAVEQSPSVITITDTLGNLEYVNPQFTESTGYSIDEAMGLNPRILKSGEQSDEFYQELWETISAGNTWRGEFHNKKKNGELFWELASVSPIFDEQGKIINYIKVAEDITERKQAEDNFRHSIDESPLGIRIANQEGKTIYVNQALLDIYELNSPKEFLKNSAIDTYTAQSYLEHQERKEIRKKGGDAFDYEISIRRKNGEIRHIKVWRKEVIWNKEKHFQVINQDITELKRLNSDLILAKEQAEESNRLKTAFLNNMSHEIRTPLNGITGFISLLQNPKLVEEQKQRYFDIINKSSDRLIATVTDILDISRIEAGEVKVSKTEVSVNEILEEQYHFFHPQAISKGLELNYSPCLAEDEAYLLTDQHKLEGILTNLIKNAIKFTEQGEITFACSLKQEPDVKAMEFSVKDTGIGIPADRIDAIFNRFEQADIEDTKALQGSGLGLAIVKSYVEMLGGEISVSSELGLGSTFTFYIPYTKQEVKQADVKGDEVNWQTLRDLSVIIAEDDETSRMYFDAIFEHEFNTIIYTTNGQDTIDKCRENPDTDLILMDIKMPGMSGYEATREIRKFNNDVVIIAQTAFGLSGDREKALEAGCTDYISKPIVKDQLFEILERYL